MILCTLFWEICSSLNFTSLMNWEVGNWLWKLLMLEFLRNSTNWKLSINCWIQNHNLVRQEFRDKISGQSMGLSRISGTLNNLLKWCKKSDCVPWATWTLMNSFLGCLEVVGEQTRRGCLKCPFGGQCLSDDGQPSLNNYNHPNGTKSQQQIPTSTSQNQATNSHTPPTQAYSRRRWDPPTHFE